MMATHAEWMARTLAARVVEYVFGLPGGEILAFIDACRRAGCYKLALSSNLKRADAHRFYDSLGFERHGFSFVTRF